MRLSLFIFTLLTTSNSIVIADEKVVLLPVLDRFLNQTKTLKVSFEQQILDQNLSIKGISRGDLYLTRPNKLRWQYEVPEKQTIIADGRFIWVYNEDLGQASSAFQNMAIKGTPADILLNPQNITKNYQVIQTGKNKVTFTPKSKKNKYRWISISFTKKGLLAELNIKDKLDQYIRFRFYNEQRDLKLDPQLFIFTAQEGDDVFEY